MRNDSEVTATNAVDADALASFKLDVPKFTIADLCRLTGWSRPTFWRHLPALPHSRVGRFVRFSERQVREILRSFEHPTIDPKGDLVDPLIRELADEPALTEVEW